MFKASAILLYVFAVFVFVTGTICLFTGSVAVALFMYVIYIFLAEVARSLLQKGYELKEAIANMDDCDFSEDCKENCKECVCADKD